ncbi:BMP family ABC transporter substrate-binding protein [Canibacter sp. lx-72]|uniref:BMP family ABC transporter substrate-binding protein n=1 Tax=Canibacter zhuwentaonis TaxID=2837491 RepID=UPI001BDDA985|nr:BMP family ABC transporter substrate-binding protein [Canibacter zhuwentaonis]MBT1018725.1 BMP family ABC transporter substrate-binding protein [Canibacter zhuwentaonis]
MTWFTRRRASVAVAGIAVASLLLSGCAGETKSSTDKDGSGDKRFIYITSDPIGQSEFLKSGQTGIEKVAKEHNGKQKIYESKDDETRRANLEQAIAEAPDVIVMLGFQFIDMAKELAVANPEQKFLLIDSVVPDAPANLYNATFKEEEASYLLGIEAAALTKTKKVGSVLSLDIEVIRDHSEGFKQGVLASDPAVQVLEPQIVGGENPFSDTARGKEQALAYAATGVDQVFAIAAAANGGIIEAAKEKGFYAYGVDANQCGFAPGSVVDGTIKSVDNVMVTMVKDILAGKSSKEASKEFGIKEGGVTVVSLTDQAASSQCVVMEHPEILQQVKDAAAKIKSGEIVVVNPNAKTS